VAVGVHRRRGFLVVAYNLELFGGAFHSDVWFALGWGVPALTAYFAQTATIRVEAVLVAAGCAAISAAQRMLSTPVRRLRRTVASDGELVTTEGAHEPLDVLAPQRPRGCAPMAVRSRPVTRPRLLVAGSPGIVRHRPEEVRRGVRRNSRRSPIT
jgi:hypothetical protein